MEIMDLVDIMNIGSLDSPHRKFVLFVFFKYGGKIKKPDANL